jgi:sugar lactone lactonase YvrE
VSERNRGRVGALLFALLSLTTALVALAPGAALASGKPFLAKFHEQSTVASTKPENQDVNPYGIVVVQQSAGRLERGNVLISNFNNRENEQGTGTTLVQISPKGHLSLFAHISAGSLPGPCPGGVGLTTALDILPNGYVVVGSLPTENGKAETAKRGCLIVLDPSGKVVRTIEGEPINGPWDMTEVSDGPNVDLFVTNVLNGTVENGEKVTEEGTVVRIALRAEQGDAPRLLSERVIATGFAERTDPEALVVGPTGVGVGRHGTLYVADTQNSRIAAVPNALSREKPFPGGGATVSQEGLLKSPLGLTIAPNGDVLTANGGDGNIVETTPSGKQVASFETNAEKGGLFGLTLAPELGGVYFVDDKENTLGLLH